MADQQIPAPNNQGQQAGVTRGNPNGPFAGQDQQAAAGINVPVAWDHMRANGFVVLPWDQIRANPIIERGLGDVAFAPVVRNVALRDPDQKARLDLSRQGSTIDPTALPDSQARRTLNGLRSHLVYITGEKEDTPCDVDEKGRCGPNKGKFVDCILPRPEEKQLFRNICANCLTKGIGNHCTKRSARAAPGPPDAPPAAPGVVPGQQQIIDAYTQHLHPSALWMLRKLFTKVHGGNYAVRSMKNKIKDRLDGVQWPFPEDHVLAGPYTRDVYTGYGAFAAQMTATENAANNDTKGGELEFLVSVMGLYVANTSDTTDILRNMAVRDMGVVWSLFAWKGQQ
ncbi:hypothetical protein MKZ38_006421 [Zalerion maritima]|uniref:Uncharacterized protein n=1 Tax=Zalerion maritima TaxID=339359 RepID=A0AAD5WNQ3_9PEZI|nr:hypothetical protein MKZ38_006421 [Zalerion maritima]